MRVVTAQAIWLLSAAAACATGSNEETSDAGQGTIDASPRADAGGGDDPDAGGGVVASSCPADQFATGFDESGALVCAAIDSAAIAAMNEQCSIYLGWRDECDGCTTAPAKWGATSGLACANGVGTDNTCATVSLGGVDVTLFGLNTDGDVNDDDKFYVGWHCALPADEHVSGPCPPGTFLWAVAPAGTECVTVRDLIAGYAGGSCNVYTGSRDNCDGCTTAPSKWGKVNSAACSNGAGASNTCTSPSLGGKVVRTFGLNTDGDVNDDDKLYVGFQCTGASPAEAEDDRSCPEGQLVVGIESNGRVRCASPLPAAEAVIQNSCQLYFGWLDECGSCSSAPSKWGRAGHVGCQNGAGAANSCTPTLLGDATIPLFGLNTDGDVDGNDKFHVGFRCE